MFVYTLYIIVFFVSVQSSFCYDFDNAEVRDLLRYEDSKQYETASSDLTTTASNTQNEMVCDKVATLHKILGEMPAMLGQDVPDNARTLYILETLKDLLKNTVGDRDEVMYKIDDLMNTLDKYREPVSNDKKTLLRVGLNNENTPKKSMLRQTLPPYQNIKLKYELPALTNSYCTEALLNIIKIAYLAYVSLAKNPICNLLELPKSPSGPDINPELIPNIGYILNPNPEIIENSYLNLPVQSNTIYESYPKTNNIDKAYPYFPLSPNLSPNQLFVPNNVYELKPPYPSENSPPLYPFFPQNLEVLPLDYNPLTPGNSVYPHEPVFKHYADDDLQPTILPWQTKKPDFPFDSKPHSQPWAPYTPDADNSQEIPKVTVPYPWSKRPVFPFSMNPQDLNLNGNPNPQELIFEIPIQNKPMRPEINPTVINYLYSNPNSYKYTIPQLLPRVPTPEYKVVDYSSDNKDTEPVEPNVIEFPYPSNTLQPTFWSPNFLNRRPESINQPNDFIPEVFPVKPLIQNLDEPLILYNKYKPNAINPNRKLPFENFILYPEVLNPNYPELVESEKPETEIYEFNINPNELSPYIPNYPYIPVDNDRVYEFEPNPNSLNPINPIYSSFPTDQHSEYEFKFNPYEPSIYPYNMPNPLPYNRPTNTPSELTPQDFNPFQPFTPPITSEVPELKIIGFMRNAIDIIEGVIPLVKFDPPTLLIIAQIKDLLFKNDRDIEAEEFVSALELYKTLINYVKQLNIYKEIIDTIDLSSVTNRPKLETQKVVELTYLVKRPQPVVYYPYYYVKYRLPFTSYVVAAQKLLRQKPYLRMNPKELYEELLTLSKVAETSPDLKSYKKEDILKLTVKSGSLVGTKLLQSNGTLNEQLNVLRDITSDLTAEDLLELNNETANELQLLASNPESLYNNKTRDFNSLRMEILLKKLVGIKNVKQDSNKEIQQEISPPIPNTLRPRSLVNTYRSDPDMYSTTKPNLEFTSFESRKLRDDILRGRYIGLPFSDYVLPSIINTHGKDEPDPKFKQELAPSLYNNLFDATLGANSYVQGQNQDFFINPAGLVNQDDEKITLNTGTANRQQLVNVYNPKVVINSATSTEGLVNVDGRTILDANKQNFMNTPYDQVDYQGLVNKHIIWPNQQSYYNSDGLFNYDNQKISLNEGTGNYQDHVNFINPKIMLNKDTNFDKIKTLGAANDVDQQNLINLNTISGFDGTKQQYFANVDSTNAKLKESSQDFQNPIKEEIRQYANPDASNMLMGKANKLDLVNFNNHLISQNDGNPFNDQDLTNVDVTKTLLNSEIFKSKNSVNFNNNEIMANSGASNQGLTNFDSENIQLNTDSAFKQNYISSNNNNMILNADTENQSQGNLNLNTGLEQQSYSVAGQQNLGSMYLNGIADQQITGSEQNFVSEMADQQAIASQQNFANIGMNRGLMGHTHHINSYWVQKMPIAYQRKIFHRFPITTSPFPFVTQFRRPVTFG